MEGGRRMDAPALVNGEVVCATSLTRHYKARVAVSNVTLSVRRGALYGLIGPDGAGKSSVMKMLAGVLTASSGRIEVFGHLVDSDRAAERVKGRLGFMPQGLGLNLYPDLSVEENI